MFNPSTPPAVPSADDLDAMSDDAFEAYETTMIEWLARAQLFAGPGPVLDVSATSPAIVERLTDALVAAALRQVHPTPSLASLYLAGGEPR